MSKSRKIGPVTIRPHVRDGTETGRWVVDVPASLTGNGKRTRRFLDNRRQAIEVARELNRRLEAAALPTRAPAEPTGPVLPEAIEGWLHEQELRVETLKKRRSTLGTDGYRLRSIARYFGDRPLTSISEAELVAYQAHRLAQGRRAVTINSEIAALGFVFRWAAKRGQLSAIPSVERIPVRPSEAVIPSPEETVRIIEALPAHLKPLVRFLAETGCRKGEALNLTWECFDEAAGNVEIRSREGWTPKTLQSERRIPLSAGLLEMIRELPRTGEYIFGSGPDGGQIDSFRKAWNTAVRKAGIMRRGRPVHLPVKTLRKANATWQAERGVGESVLQSLLGHAKGSRITRQFYVHVTEDAKRAAVIALPMTGQPAGNAAGNLATSGNKAENEQATA